MAILLTRPSAGVHAEDVDGPPDPEFLRSQSAGDPAGANHQREGREQLIELGAMG